MKSIISCILSLLWIASASAQGLQILNKDGSPLPASQQKVDIHTQVIEEEDGIRTVTYRLTSKVDEVQLFQVRYTLNFVGPKPTVFDGLNLLPATTSEHKQRLLFLGAFPLTAAWDSHKGMALAAGAQDDHSFLHFTMNRQPQGVQMIQTVQAALMGKGSTYTGRFHVIAFSPKYEQADALARYYQLYPDRFKRNPSVHPRLYCTSAAYYSWRGTNAERTRMAHADWEWCIHPMRHWGDLLAEHYDELKLA